MTIVWFRLDLRLADNPALTAAGQRGEVLPVFIWAPEEGDWPPGAASRAWLCRSLRALDVSLRERGGRLVVRRGPALKALRKLVSETGADAVFWSRRYEPALRERDAKVQRALIAVGLRVETFNSALLVEPWEIKTGKGEPYRVFTPFYRACLSVIGPRTSVRTSAKAPYARISTSLRSDPLPSAEVALDASWEPGEAGALRRLAGFAKRARSSSAKRDRPDLDGTSRLSPHLHFGEVAPWRVWEAIPVAAFRRQLIWREFAYHLLWHFPMTTSEPLRPEFARLPWRQDAQALLAWQRGRTGFAMVDAGMRQLLATGWMH
ncbi:MAG: DNA photolyase family protein [Verrucomicrobiae bacterium]|nr:DNA photolyase family protein [Verrucomicrobiae bacterium]